MQSQYMYPALAVQPVLSQPSQTVLLAQQGQPAPPANATLLF